MADLITVAGSAPGTTDFWKKFEGQVLDGEFPLGSYMGSGNAGATFASKLTGHEEPVLIKIIRSGSAGWERRIASWTLAKTLQHPNLLRVYACGLGSLDGLRVAYAVTEYPDAKLTSVLMERCLTVDEGRELLHNCAQALQYLHQKGLVHAHVQPADVVSVDEVIKLSSDYLIKAGEPDGLGRTADPYVAPEVVNSGYTPASDIWSLGATLLQSVVGTLPETGHEEAAPDPHTPYSEILRQCLETKPANRWTARQILAALKNPAPQAAAQAPPQAPLQAAPVPKQVDPARSLVPEPSRLRVLTAQLARAGNLPALKYAIPALAILLVGFAWLSTQAVRRPVSSTVIVVPNEPPVLKQTDEADRAKAAAAPVPAPAAKTAVPEPVQPSASKPQVAAARTWSVVVYTYSHPGSAENKAAEINRKSPDLQAHVLATDGGSPYLVVLGNGMDRKAVMRLQHKRYGGACLTTRTCAISDRTIAVDPKS